jgi:hypothetical protein
VEVGICGIFMGMGGVSEWCVLTEECKWEFCGGSLLDKL